VLIEEKLDETGARLEHTPQKSLGRLEQEAGISKPLIYISSTKLISTYLNGTETVYVHRDIIFSTS
jgi:hypothetical protein